MLRSTLPLGFLLVLQLSGTDAQLFSLVREGDDVTLSCRKVLPGQNWCQFTDWTLEKSKQRTELFIGGRRKDGDTSSSTLLQNCSLVLHRVTVEQSGAYVMCRQKRGIDVEFQLFVPSVFQKKEDDRVTLTCSMNVRMCPHDVRWLNNGEEVTTDHPELQMCRSNSRCEVSVSFKDPSPPSPFYQTLKCQVKQRNSDPILITGTRPEEAPHTDHSAGLLLRHVLLPVGLVALLLSVAALHLYARVKGRRASERSRTNVNREGAVVYENVGEPSVSVRLRSPSYEN